MPRPPKIASRNFRPKMGFDFAASIIFGLFSISRATIAASISFFRYSSGLPTKHLTVNRVDWDNKIRTISEIYKFYGNMRQIISVSKLRDSILNELAGSGLVQPFPMCSFRSGNQGYGATNESKMDPGKSQQRSFRGLKGDAINYARRQPRNPFRVGFEFNS